MEQMCQKQSWVTTFIDMRKDPEKKQSMRQECLRHNLQLSQSRDVDAKTITREMKVEYIEK